MDKQELPKELHRVKLIDDSGEHEEYKNGFDAGALYQLNSDMSDYQAALKQIEEARKEGRKEVIRELYQGAIKELGSYNGFESITLIMGRKYWQSLEKELGELR